MNLTGPRRTGPNDDETTAPVELPHVLVSVAADGTLTAAVDGTPFASPDGTAWTRATFGPLMDAITKDRTIAVRVEVRESDGSVFTDILRTRKPRRAAVPSETPVPETRRPTSSGSTRRPRRGPVPSSSPLGRARRSRRPRHPDMTGNTIFPVIWAPLEKT